ncbi:hypothetical protein ABID49_002380 [Bhargavaea ullalensis]|uniref:Uncharacterized protein n=1 Tax=Bhargavaea ullalensis TaxID=1265685 RepID=A0ABV2GDT9_9BACL
MRKSNIILFLVLVVMAIIWGAVYWLFIAPNAGPPSQ